MLAKESIRLLKPMTYLFTGPMEAGKTYHLMRTVQNLLGTANPVPFGLTSKSRTNTAMDSIPIDDSEMMQNGYAAAIFCKPVLDTRTDSTLESRNGTVFQNVEAVESLDTIEFTENTLIAVDEAQFFDASLLRLFDRIQETPGCTMVVAGLDRDYLKEPFGHVLELAQKIVMNGSGMGQVNLLRAPCHVNECTNPAGYTKRLIESDTQILIGDSESYVAACGKHHNLDRPTYSSRFINVERMNK